MVIPATLGRVDSEVGRLRRVIVHRPGPELARITPRNSAALLFDGIPWLARAQEEHDAFAELMRAHGVEVYEVSTLLAEVLQQPDARSNAMAAAIAGPHLGAELADALHSHLADLGPRDLATTLVAGLSRRELTSGSGLLWRLMADDDFVLDPLPNLLFTRDSAVRIGDHVALTSLARSARARESSLVDLIWTHHPLLRRTPVLYRAGWQPLEGGDVLTLAPGVVAVGTGERTTPAGVEKLAQQLFATRTCHTVLAVPIEQSRATMHLDTVCTMVDRDALVMHPPLAGHLMAYVMRRPEPEAPVVVSEPIAFLDAVSNAVGVDRMRVIGTGEDPIAAEREQWDDGANTLALAPGLAVAYERNVVTNGRLEAAGIEVLRLRGSELGTGRGGPRCMSCPLTRDALS